jgi:hypothetical protein
MNLHCILKTTNPSKPSYGALASVNIRTARQLELHRLIAVEVAVE